MKTIKLMLAAALSVVTVMASLLPTASSANDLKPGETISRLNVERIKDLVSPGIYWTVENGMDMKIVPYQKISPPQFFLDATEKYGSQITGIGHNITLGGVHYPLTDLASYVHQLIPYNRYGYFIDL